MNAQQMAQLQQMQQMQQMQMQQMQMQQSQNPYGAPAAAPTYPGTPATYPQQNYQTTSYPQPTPGGTPYQPTQGYQATPGGSSGVNLKAIKLPDGVSLISVNVSEISCRGPSGGIITMSPPPPKPDFEREANVKPLPFGPSKSGPCHKMGFTKPLGMVRWNKRMLKLDGKTVDWNTKDSKKNKVIELRSGLIIEKTEHDSPKRRDAHEVSGMASLTTPMFATHVGEVGKNNSIGIHVPVDPFAQMNALVNTSNEIGKMSPLQMMSRSHSLMGKIQKAITYYFYFDSGDERDEWYKALSQNLEAAATQNYVPFQYFINLATQAGVANANTFNWREILTELYSGQ